jgi:hypothetical protein
MKDGNHFPAKINVYDEEWFPEIADLVKGMSDTQIRSIECMVSKDPADTWATVAKRIGISERQLRNIRQEENVQDACYRISKKLFKSDLPDVFRVLSRKAKSGQAWAVKLFLEVSGELADNAPREGLGLVNPDEMRRKAEEALAQLKVLSDEELHRKLVERLRSHGRTVN